MPVDQVVAYTQEEEMNPPISPATYKRKGLPVPKWVEENAKAKRRMRYTPTGKPPGRPITSEHPRAKYWREWRRKKTLLTRIKPAIEG
jgi:hypothetical protein